MLTECGRLFDQVFWTIRPTYVVTLTKCFIFIDHQMFDHFFWTLSPTFELTSSTFFIEYYQLFVSAIKCLIHSNYLILLNSYGHIDQVCLI